MRISDRLLICIIPFILIFGTGLYNNSSTSDFEVFSKRYWDFTRLISGGFNTPYHHFLIGLTVIVNRGLKGGDELVSNTLELLGSKNILIKLIRFWDTYPPGTPTLTILSLILILCKIYSICTSSSIFRRSDRCDFQNKDVIIENLGNDLGTLVKGIVKNKSSKSQKSNDTVVPDSESYFTREILGLENSINSLSHISSEITESLYNFISAFHVDQHDFPDSNELFNLKSETLTNKHQNNHLSTRQSNVIHGSNNQIPSSNSYSNTFSLQESPNIASHIDVPFSTNNVNNGQSIDNQIQVSNYLDSQNHQNQINSEAPPLQFSESSFSFPSQTVSNVFNNTEQSVDNAFSQNKDIDDNNVDHVEYSGGAPNINTTYEFNSNIYSSLI